MADYRAEARKAARRYGLDPNIFVRQIRQESGFNPHARSPAGAQGIAQIMPATARGWGVNPNDPVASLNAAAKNMASYVRRYGGYENALRAYNAGPGNISRSRGFSETNNYVKTILGGRDPGRLASSRTTPDDDESSGDRTRTVTTTTPGVDNKLARLSLVQSFLDEHGSDPVDFAVQARALRDIPATTTSKTVRVPGSSRQPSVDTGTSGGGSDSFAKAHSPLFELFYDPQGGWKNGQSIGPIGGHSDHVHVAAGPKTTVALGKLAQSMGLHVGENPNFGGVAPVHTTNSYHYRKGGEAIDVSGTPAKMAAYARRVRRLYGIK